jgi:hypothetical protein
MRQGSLVRSQHRSLSKSGVFRKSVEYKKSSQLRSGPSVQQPVAPLVCEVRLGVVVPDEAFVLFDQLGPAPRLREVPVGHPALDVEMGLDEILPGPPGLYGRRRTTEARSSSSNPFGLTQGAGP